MGMHHNLGAAVVFTVDNFDKETIFRLDKFYDNVSEIKEKIVELKESSKVSVKFESPDENSYLEIKNIFNGQGEYIKINPNESQKLFEGLNKYSILLPGDHLIRIFYKGNYYYNIYSVNPRHVNELQLQFIRDYVNSRMEGISYNLNTFAQINRIKKNIIKSNYINVIKIYKENFLKLIKLLDEIIKSPLTELEKAYMKGQNVKKQDLKTIRFSGRRNGGERLEIKKIPTLNSRENKILKAMLLNIYMELRDLETFLNEHKEVKGNFNDYNLLIKDLRYMKNLLSKYIDFFVDVDSTNKVVPLKSILMNSKYGKIYKLYRKFIDYKNYYQPNFKTTDLLYEYFVLLVVLDIIKELGFNLEDSDYKNLLKNKLNDEIPSGTGAIFTRGNLRLEVWYEKELYSLYHEALKNGSGFYTHASNKLPDIRIDFYKNDKYIKSYIIEVKYRRFGYLWSDLENNETMVQIKNYRMTIQYISKDLEKPISPIEKVIVIYPGQVDMGVLVEKEFGNYLFLQLKPKDASTIMGYDELKKIIKELINEPQT
ncbi:MAG: nuclease domain-containing protein [Caloramator sp.]|nr:nuclease domain-containing protein [Caloramator sp.]